MIFRKTFLSENQEDLFDVLRNRNFQQICVFTQWRRGRVGG